MMNYRVDTLELGPFMTASGESIENLKLRYEYVGYSGQPLAVVCHALTGNHLTYGTEEKPGWWREIIDGGYVPVHDYQFLTFNVIGSPFGSSSRLTDPNFPQKLTLRDIVRALEMGIAALGYQQIDVLIGGSLGGCKSWNFYTIKNLMLKKRLYLQPQKKPLHIVELLMRLHVKRFT